MEIWESTEMVRIGFLLVERDRAMGHGHHHRQGAGQNNDRTTKRSSRHSVVAAGSIDGVTVISANVHMPTSWAPQKDFEAALTQLDEDLEWIKTKAEYTACNLVIAGDWHVE